jgi:hypothetical protein
MLKSYAAIYKHGHLDWLDDVPQQENMQVIVTFIQPIPPKTAKKIRPFGLCAGEFVVPDDFDAPLPDDILNLFE